MDNALLGGSPSWTYLLGLGLIFLLSLLFFGGGIYQYLYGLGKESIKGAWQDMWELIKGLSRLTRFTHLLFLLLFLGGAYWMGSRFFFGVERYLYFSQQDKLIQQELVYQGKEVKRAKENSLHIDLNILLEQEGQTKKVHISNASPENLPYFEQHKPGDKLKVSINKDGKILFID